MKTAVIWFKKDEDGQGMVEYSLILALIALAVIGGLNLLGNITNELFKNAVNMFS